MAEEVLELASGEALRPGPMLAWAGAGYRVAVIRGCREQWSPMLPWHPREKKSWVFSRVKLKQRGNNWRISSAESRSLRKRARSHGALPSALGPKGGKDMPKLDGTGPNRKGPMTGRGSGYCLVPLNTTEQKLEFLRNRELSLREQLGHVERRIRYIESKTALKEVAR